MYSLVKPYFYFFSSFVIAFFFSERVINVYATGHATHKDANAPTATPINNANAKPLNTSPPKINTINNTNKVDPNVLNVRLNV